MYHDSDDEAVSGDEAETVGGSLEDTYLGAKRPRKVISKRFADDGGRCLKYHRLPRSEGGGTVNAKEEPVRTKRHGSTRKGHNMYPVFVLDYDLTLVNRSSRPFPGSHEFIQKLRDFNDGQNQLILYSHGSAPYIDDGLNKHYENERKFFDEIISDSSARNNKPVTHVRRIIKDLHYLIGPYVIVDDMRSNLDSDQYDIVVDVTRMTNYDPKGVAVSVDYDTCMRTIEQGVKLFLNTKRKSLQY